MTERLPWLVALAACAVAAGAGALLLQRPVAPEAAELDQLRREVRALRQAQPPEGPKPQPPPTTPRADARPAQVLQPVDGAAPPPASGEIPPEVLEAAVDREIERRRQEKLTRALPQVEAEWHGKMADAVLELVDAGGLDPELGPAVTTLLQREASETLDIKLAVGEGDLSHDDAKADWATLRAETDDALLEHVDEPTLDRIREVQDRK